MKRIVTSFLMGTLILFVTSVYAAEPLTFTNEDLNKYDNKSMPMSEGIDQSNNRQRDDHTKIQKTSQTQVAESVKYIGESDKGIIIKHCKEVWDMYRTALSRGEIEESLKYVSNGSKEGFRQALKIQNRSSELGDITSAEVIEASSARFKMFAKAKLQSGDSVIPGHSVGDSVAVNAYVVFSKDTNDNWKIDFY